MTEPPPCRYCHHSLSAHYEDGPDAPPTSCADMGPQNQGCPCTGYVGPREEP